VQHLGASVLSSGPNSKLNEYARPVARPLFNIEQFLKVAPCSFSGFPLSRFPSIKIRRLICKKGPRGFRRRSKSGRKRPGRAATAGAIADLVLQIKEPGALTVLNLCSRFLFN
jgi:hypothetical protein